MTSRLALFGLIGAVAVASLPAVAQDLDPENTIVITTSDGCKITAGLRPDLAPKHVAQVKKLVREGFYNGIIFHRVIEGFMAQTGDPTGTGMGGSKEPDLKAEFSKAHFDRGTLGMARAQDPDSANSQFFIMFADGGFLDGQYTVFGGVASGLECVDKIAKGEPPANPTKMVSVKILKDVQ
jgi:cyclophilin family peptidyl-prolyl cis-trans isomerase